MKIAFTDKIWSRLYGPYGNRSVNARLMSLSERWDKAAATELFWEELHHQDDIYPSTFAALPWLVEVSPSHNEAFKETHLFLSHVIHCACTEGGTGCDGAEPRGKYRGLSTVIADHQHSWIPQSEWLTVEDQPILIGLEQWFSENWKMIANRCLNLIGSDLVVSAHAIEGFASANGSSRVARSIQMFADGEDVDFISRELGGYDDRDALVVAKLYPHVHERSPDLASFLLDYPGCNFVPDDPRQRSLF
ncbi:hypothetical protein [Rhodovulum sp. FJ3]|uniref:hypothetical protein n=1 Tax=Rhodovulum sp. FJ3 TaxID=3079053 RepID=UPI002942754F|nr:hypothetical protein [Rhodovulum sp. FJ3]